MAERFLNTNGFTQDELKGKAVNANTQNTINNTNTKKKIWDYHHVMSPVVCVGKGSVNVILSCIQ